MKMDSRHRKIKSRIKELFVYASLKEQSFAR